MRFCINHQGSPQRCWPPSGAASIDSITASPLSRSGPPASAGDWYEAVPVRLRDGTRTSAPQECGPGLGGQIPAIVAANASSFQMGPVNLQSGNNGTTVNLHGLNPAHPLIRGSSLASFAPAVLWQDQNNSTVKYDSNGYVDYKSCGGAHSLDDPCTNTLTDNKSPELDIQASPNIHLYGFVYQPRGAWATLQGGGGYAGPMQLITGALNVQGNANIDLLGLATPLTQTVVALIE
jgi:hypothetical protein